MVDPMRAAALCCLCLVVMSVPAMGGRGYGDDEDSFYFNLVQAPCPTWAACPEAGQTLAQSPYDANACVPGFGFLPFPHSKYYDEDDSYYSKSKDEEYYEGKKFKGSCFPCKSGFWAPGGCQPCRACGEGDGFFTVEGAGGIQDCLCREGYGGPLCEICAINTYSPGGTLSNPRPECKACPENTVGTGINEGSIDVTACGGCIKGTYRDATCVTCASVDKESIACKACPPDTSGDGGEGVESCGPVTCAVGSYLDTDSNTCKACPNGSGSSAGAVGLGSCGCGAGFYMDVALGACQTCPTGSSSASGATSINDCNICDNGYGITAADAESECCGRCTPCPDGFASGGGEKAICTRCPANTSSFNGQACLCDKPGYGNWAYNEYYLERDPVCGPCPDGTFSQVMGTGSDNQCVACNFWLNTGPFEVLGVPEEFQNVPFKGYTTFGPGATSPAQCACAAGYGYNEISGACEPCAAPSFQGILGPGGNPQTTATPQNPLPPCVMCAGAVGTTPISSVGTPNGQCLFPAGWPSAYCAPAYPDCGPTCGNPPPSCMDCLSGNLDYPGNTCDHDYDCCTGTCDYTPFNNDLRCCFPQGIQCVGDDECCSGHCDVTALSGNVNAPLGYGVCRPWPPCFSGDTLVRIQESDTPIAIRDLKTGQHVQCLGTNEDLRLPTDVSYCKVMNWLHAEEAQTQQTRITFTRPSGAPGSITMSKNHLILKLTDASTGSTAARVDQLGAFETAPAFTVLPGDKLAVLTDERTPSAGFTVVTAATVETVLTSGIYLPVVASSPYIVAAGVVAPLFTTVEFDVVVPPATYGAMTAAIEYAFSPLMTNHIQPVGTPGTKGGWNGSPVWPGINAIRAAGQAHRNAGGAVDFEAARDWFMPRFTAWKADPSKAITLEDVVAALSSDALWVPAPPTRRNAAKTGSGEEIVADSAALKRARHLMQVMGTLRGNTTRTATATARATKRRRAIPPPLGRLPEAVKKALKDKKGKGRQSQAS